MKLEELRRRYCELEGCVEDVGRAIEVICGAYEKGGTVFTCGNGGSAADAEHIVGELMKGFLSKRRLKEEERAVLARWGERGIYLAEHLQQGLRAISLVTSVSLATAFANDVAAELVFAQQVYGLGRAGDVLIAISTSGRSKNVVYAVVAAKARGLGTIGLSGASGGILKELCDVTICAPSTCTPEIQEYHEVIYHCICEEVEARFFENSR
ncbi:MAG: SIS domain-containing protein [bacterium]|nr:SIS domain-containing protein [bacterium]